ncbi:zinc finger protein [Trichonephila clavipes]|uniref:Zinc finger protein n=1 Tax=Trichonephila clavipes TaxID=2585209 RepID=A0A8X6SDW5_TRICX|nr:zinc finger protein [Trichonephila clavipes]
MRISHKRLTIWKTTFAVLLPIYGHKCWKKSSKIGRPDWTTSEPAGIPMPEIIFEIFSSLSEHVQLHSAGKCRINIKFLVKLKKSVTKPFQILTEAYGDETLYHADVFELFKRFSRERVYVEDDEPAGRPRFREKIRKKRSQTGSDGSLLHEDNASAHMTLPVKQSLTSKNTTMMGHPLYLPDIAQ